MPRAYAVLVELTSVDFTTGYYSRRMPGFDGKAVCEGVRRNLQRMARLTHYLGFETIPSKPLVDAEATRAHFLATLALAAHPTTGLNPGDILFLYASCHGQIVGEGPDLRLGALVGRYVNRFLLHDAPIFNFEILVELLKQGTGKLNEYSPTT